MSSPVLDFRVNVDFFTHHKTAKLKRLLGKEGVYSLLSLWGYAAKHRQDGILSGMDEEDIAVAADWDGEAEKLLNAFCKAGFLEWDDCVAMLHDWETHNPWVQSSGSRSDKGRMSRMKKLMKDSHDFLFNKGVRCISSPIFRALKDNEISNEEAFELTKKSEIEVKEYLSNLRSKKKQPSSNLQATLSRPSRAAKEDLKVTTTPSPTPAPTPSPTPVPAPVPAHSGKDSFVQNSGLNESEILEPEIVSEEQEYEYAKGKKLKSKRLVWFERFWEAFGDKRGKAGAAKSWAAIPDLTDSLCQQIVNAAIRYRDIERPAILQRNNTPKMAQGWLTDRRWEDDPNALGAHCALQGNSQGFSGQMSAAQRRTMNNQNARLEAAKMLGIDLEEQNAN